MSLSILTTTEIAILERDILKKELKYNAKLHVL